ncbi:MAG: ATP synthase F1 subunit delta [Elainellaceae cyanobacterium]
MANIVISQVVSPYAEALMSIAKAHDLTDRIAEDMSFLKSALEESDELSAFLENPLLLDDVKKAVLRQVSSEQLHPYTLNFLMLLVDRKRILLLKDVCKRYKELLRQLNKTVLAEVVSAVPISDDQKDAVRQKVIDITGAHAVDLEASLDPDLIGGVVIKVGSQVFDASLRGQLRRIGLSLKA